MKYMTQDSGHIHFLGFGYNIYFVTKWVLIKYKFDETH
jgi:hypothetical protein